MNHIENINMLFLLTWGDIRAVGPEAWTDWKGSLLEKLYLKTREVIWRGEFSQQKTLEHVQKIKEAFLSQLGEKYSREALDDFLSAMPPRYFFAATQKEMEKHFLLFKKEYRGKVITEFDFLPEEQVNEILVYTLYSPKVFPLVAGVMASQGVNILRADVFQTRDGHILLALYVTGVQGKPIQNPDRFDRIRLNLEKVLSGQVQVDHLIQQRVHPEYLAKKPVQKAKSRVVIDNDVSAYYTVIDVYAHDRLGLLYDIIRTLTQLGCYVEVSKISTKVEQVSDAFYVKDIFGKKISSKQKLHEIKAALMEVVSP